MQPVRRGAAAPGGSDGRFQEFAAICVASLSAGVGAVVFGRRPSREGPFSARDKELAKVALAPRVNGPESGKTFLETCEIIVFFLISGRVGAGW